MPSSRNSVPLTFFFIVAGVLGPVDARLEAWLGEGRYFNNSCLIIIIGGLTDGKCHSHCTGSRSSLSGSNDETTMRGIPTTTGAATDQDH